MPPTKPKHVKFTTPPPDGKVGQELTFKVDGEATDGGDGGGVRKTGLLLQIFYRSRGVPFQEVRKEILPHNVAAFTKDFKWTPRREGRYGLRVIAWDSRRNPENGRDHRTSLTHVRVT
jgi:hypothetical protein